MHKKPSVVSGRLICGLVVVVALLAWVTYGTFAGVLGMITYLLVGLLAIFPWVVPFIGIPLGILDLFDLLGLGIYDLTLRLSHLESSWLSVLWYALVAIVASVAGVAVSIWLVRLALRKRPQPRDLALLNCHIIDGSRRGQIIQDGVILIKNVVGDGETPGRISAVGPAGTVDIPAGYHRVDLGGQFVLPGFINAHCHLLASGKPMRLFRFVSENEAAAEKVIRLLTTSLGKRLVLRSMTGNAKNALHAGVTTLRTMADLAYLDVRLRKQIEEGKVLGPRLLVAGPGICPSGGHGSWVAHVADSPTEIKRAVRINIREEVDWIKILSTGGVTDARRVGEAGQPQMTVEEIETACIHAHRAGVMVATHCESTKGIEEALLGGVDTIEHGAEIPHDLVPLFKDNPKALRGYTALVPTLAAAMGISTLPIEVTQMSQVSFENALLIGREMVWGLQRAVAEDIPLAMGTDASLPYAPHYEFWKELKYYLHYTDLTPQDVIHLATKNSAEILGIGEETGSIEVGKSADLQVVAGNPLKRIDHLERVTKVVIRGLLIDQPRVKRIKALDEVPITDMIEVGDG